MISHLKQQVADGKVDTEQLAALGVMKLALEQQVRKLTDDLFEARSAHTPVRLNTYSVQCGLEVCTVMGTAEIPR